MRATGTGRDCTERAYLLRLAADQVQQLLAHGTKLLLQLSLVGHHLCCLLLNMFKQRNTPCSTSVTSRLYRLLFALPLGTHRLLRLGKAIENTPRGTLGANNVLERNTEQVALFLCGVRKVTPSHAVREELVALAQEEREADA